LFLLASKRIFFMIFFMILLRI